MPPVLSSSVLPEPPTGQTQLALDNRSCPERVCLQDIGWGRVNVGAGRVGVGCYENSQCRSGKKVRSVACSGPGAHVPKHYMQSLSVFSKECVYRVSSSLLGV